MSYFLELFSTEKCHLCEQAEAIITHTLDLQRWQVEWVDIAEDDELIEKYALHIPVLCHALSGKALYWPFTAEQLLDFVQQCESSAE